MIKLIQAHAGKIPLENESIQCIITSPPYWGLRVYEGNQNVIWGGYSKCPHSFDKIKSLVVGGGYSEKSTLAGFTSPNTKGRQMAGETSVISGVCNLCGAEQSSFGLEPSLKMYIDHTVLIFREMWRVLKNDGVMFWNIADSYAGGGNYRGIKSTNTLTEKQRSNRGATGVHQELGALGKDTGSAKPKDLCLIPQRVAIAAQEDGWWVRSDIIWHKPNPMPESCKDRPTDSYEHILMLTKSNKYYWDKDAVKEPAAWNRWGKQTSLKRTGGYGWIPDKSKEEIQKIGLDRKPGDAIHGNLPGRSDGGRACNKPDQQFRNLRNVWTIATSSYSGAHFAVFPEELPRKCILAASKPGDMILDPFAGSGTTGKVANELNRDCTLIDIAYGENDEYRKLTEQRLKEPPKKVKIPKVAKAAQAGLFE